MLLVDDLAAGGTKNLRHTPRGLVTLLLYVHSSIVIILMGKRELIALLNLSFWCLVMVEWLFLVVPWDCLQFVIVVFPDRTDLVFYYRIFKRLA